MRVRTHFLTPWPATDQTGGRRRQGASTGASLEPLKKEYSDSVAKMGELPDRITFIDPTWEPPTAPRMPDCILEWVKG